MAWQEQLRGDSLAWLLEAADPGVRFLALRDLLDLPAEDKDLVAAREAAHREGPIAAILDAMAPEGYWAKPGPGYGPKYRSSVWSIITLGQVGASIELDPRLERACAYLLDHALSADGRFSTGGTPYGNIDCLHGNLCAALVELGCNDPRLERAFEWAARSVTGEGVAPAGTKDSDLAFAHYNTGPNFACRANNGHPCAWGAIKIMLAFSKWPEDRRTPLIARAIEQGREFLLSVDPAEASYPTRFEGDEPDKRWWQFGFPVYYVTDLLQNAEALAGLGYGQDPRLAGALAAIRDQPDPQGRWKLAYRYYPAQTWADFGRRGQPNKWVTLRALRVLKAVV